MVTVLTWLGMMLAMALVAIGVLPKRGGTRHQGCGAKDCCVERGESSCSGDAA